MARTTIEQILRELEASRRYLAGLKEDLSESRLDRERLLRDIERLRERLQTAQANATNKGSNPPES